MESQVFFMYLSFRMTYLFWFWENILFTSYVTFYMLVVPVGKRSNSRSQMFYKIDALKNLAIFNGKHLCWSFSLVNSIKKRLQHWRFPGNIVKCLSTGFYIGHLLFIRLFRSFVWWQNSLDVFGYKIFHISGAIALFSFIALMLECEVYCYFVYVLFLLQNFY